MKRGLAIWRWLVGLFVGGSHSQESTPYGTRVVEESLPEDLVSKTLYVVDDDGFLEQAAMLCPCGCQRILHMNLLPDEHPFWQLTLHADDTATLYPSIWRKKDCMSHFWFRRGQVIWCNDEVA